jgi:hypothetical protein
MQTGEIARALLADPFTSKYFRGVYASDTLPHDLISPSLFVTNVDPHLEAGSHWVCIYVDRFGKADFFDSYGLPPIVKNHYKYLKRYCTSWTYNSKRLQSPTSSVCGHYCVLYLMCRARGVSLRGFLKHFRTGTPTFNDRLVKKIFTKHFPSTYDARRGNSSIVQRCCPRI